MSISFDVALPYNSLAMKRRLRLAITGGGTGGHLSPAVAVIDEIRAREDLEAEILYLGSKNGIESTVIPLMGIEYKQIPTGKLRRYLSLQNFLDIFRVIVGILKSLIHLSSFKPEVLFATGGYVSVPSVVAASLLKIPVVIHEQTGSLGLANRICARFADVIAISIPDTTNLPPHKKTVLTGNPVRKNVLSGSKQNAARRFGFDLSLPTIYITGGAQGSHKINTIVGEALPQLLSMAQIIHQTGDSEHGKQDYEHLTRIALSLPQQLQQRYMLFRYIGNEIGDIYAISDLVVGRAGAGTVNELTVLGKPSVLIPLPHSAGDEQRANAERLAQVGAAVVIEEAELSSNILVDTIRELVTTPDKLRHMSEAASQIALERAEHKLVDLILQVVESKNTNSR